MEYKEDLLPSKELNHCIDDFYKSINFKRADWLNNKQKKHVFRVHYKEI